MIVGVIAVFSLPAISGRSSRGVKRIAAQAEPNYKRMIEDLCTRDPANILIVVHY